MMNKIFGVKNITHLLYGFLICMPMLSILARTCYVAINKNAKDSYSDTYIYNNVEITNPSDVAVGTKYTLTSKGVDSTANQFANQITYLSLTKEQLNVTQSQYDNINFILVNTQGYIRFSNSSAPTTWITSITNEKGLSFDVIFNTSNNSYANLTSWFYVNQIVLQNNKLDNAFEYSLSQFTKDNNLGNVDIFSWFTNLFLDQTNPTNQLYLGFVNWYLNYTLLVSSGYLLFLTLIWFVNYVRRILDKSMNQEYGGF